MKKNRKIYWLIGISIIILVFAVVSYILEFKDSCISNKTSDWGDFAEYLNLFVGFCSLIIITYITIYVHRNTLIIEKPMVIFKINANKTSYVIKNIGKGAAMNIVLKHKNNKTSNHWDSSVKCYSLAPNDELEITWKKGGDEWFAIYDDIFLTHYYSDIKDDFSEYGILSELDYKKATKGVVNTIWSIGTLDK